MLVIAFLMSILMTFPIAHFSKMFTSALVLGMGDFESVVQETASLAHQKLLRGKNRSLLCLARILHTGHNLLILAHYTIIDLTEFVVGEPKYYFGFFSQISPNL